MVLINRIRKLTDLHKINQCDGILSTNFGNFISGMKDCIEHTGSGAEKRRIVHGTDVKKTTNIVYTSIINSIRQLVKLIVKYLTTEKNLVIGNDFNVPCNELVCR